MSKDSIDPNHIKTRDYLLLQIIKGATKAGIHRDKRKHNSKYKCRKSKTNRSEE